MPVPLETSGLDMGIARAGKMSILFLLGFHSGWLDSEPVRPYESNAGEWFNYCRV